VSWRFARTPKWLVRHVLVALLVLTMIALGFWQLRRLDEKKDYKALVEARQEVPIADVEAVVPADRPVGSPAVEKALYRSVRATGTYDAADTVVVENRTFNSAPGAWVLTPLRLDDGTAVVVNRGFIGYDHRGEIVAPPPPTGTVTVEGLVFPSQPRGRFGAVDPASGRLTVLARVDLDRYAEQLDVPILPAYIQLVTSRPGEPAPARGAPELVALGPPEPDLGPHLSYAVQWFLFTTIAVVGYGLLLRKVAREGARQTVP
jgi:surfeit locus 1 family protein